ncbi:YgiW/YdeI family stress tolerance OB fold protein [Pleurocapsa sp. PCC 7319]|uniref:YgiW/YdeI family stress tolerance OB fold protein n=1 Tax=Pleurocapsa sp. PCC 7319 TaxID=118161 RepID=UPI00034CF524|nr:NirD/YgiW/YdeI family stress tolerance protein [Pleurocapsa sp. PCC 7319]
MPKINTVLTLIALNFIVCANAVSQTNTTTVSSILDNPVDGQKVILRGKIIGHQQNETDYTFTDNTNEITIELEDDNYPFNSNTTVEISGIVDFESEHPDEAVKDPTPEKIQIRVDQLQVVNSNE